MWHFFDPKTWLFHQCTFFSGSKLLNYCEVCVSSGQSGGVTEWMWKMHVVGSEQGYEGVFAYEACSDNVEGLHMADEVKWPIVKSFWLELHLKFTLEGTNWSASKLHLGKNKHIAVWWWGKDAGMNHSQIIRSWNYILWVLMEKN